MALIGLAITSQSNEIFGKHFPFDALPSDWDCLGFVLSMFIDLLVMNRWKKLANNNSIKMKRLRFVGINVYGLHKLIIE